MDELIIGRLQFHSLNVISRTAKSNGQNNGTKGLASYLIGHQVPPVGLASIFFFRLKKKNKKIHWNVTQRCRNGFGWGADHKSRDPWYPSARRQQRARNLNGRVQKECNTPITRLVGNIILCLAGVRNRRSAR